MNFRIDLDREKDGSYVAEITGDSGESIDSGEFDELDEALQWVLEIVEEHTRD